MIRNDSEYKEAVERLAAEKGRIEEFEKKFADEGLSHDEVSRAIEPIRSFHEQLAEELSSYEALRRGEIGEINNLRSFGRLLVCLRIFRGMSQRELADKLGVHESQVSRDERNEYHGITLDRAARIIEALSVEIHIGVEPKEHVVA